MTKILWFLKFEKVKHSLLSDMIPGHYKSGIGSFFHPPPAESLNFRMKLSNAQSNDSEFDKFAVKVNRVQKVKSTKNQERLNFGINGFYRSKHNSTYF